MRIEKSYRISESVFTRIYRAHCHIKFHIRRSMVLSFCLLVFGLVMDLGFDKDYGWMNGIVAVLFIVSLLCNYVCEVQIPKAAYRSLYEDEQDHSTIVLDEDGVSFGEGNNLVYRSWDQYHQCFETKDAFLLYQKDFFTMIWKEVCDDQVAEVRELLKEKVNHGKPLRIKK